MVHAGLPDQADTLSLLVQKPSRRLDRQPEVARRSDCWRRFEWLRSRFPVQFVQRGPALSLWAYGDLCAWAYLPYFVFCILYGRAKTSNAPKNGCAKLSVWAALVSALFLLFDFW